MTAASEFRRDPSQFEAAARELFLLAPRVPDGLDRLRAWAERGGLAGSMCFAERIEDGVVVIAVTPAPSMLALLDDLRRAAGGVAA